MSWLQETNLFTQHKGFYWGKWGWQSLKWHLSVGGLGCWYRSVGGTPPVCKAVLPPPFTPSTAPPGDILGACGTAGWHQKGREHLVFQVL